MNRAVVCGITDEEPTFAKVKNIYYGLQSSSI